MRVYVFDCVHVCETVYLCAAVSLCTPCPTHNSLTRNHNIPMARGRDQHFSGPERQCIYVRVCMVVCV